MIQVGDLVRAKHWDSRYIALVVSIRPKGSICTVMINGDPDHKVDQLIKDLEVIA
jgi:hypothetical protein